jgi:peptide deformylase
VSVLDIHVLGSPVLREETVPVAEVTDELRSLIRDMFETMYAANGIGLAAPQIGRRERIAVIDVAEKPFAIINPEIVEREGTVRGEEGCLSIPEVYGDVERSARVVVRGLDEQGRPLEVEGTDLLARCLQHEIDHLHGRLFIDYRAPSSGGRRRRSGSARRRSTRPASGSLTRRRSRRTTPTRHCERSPTGALAAASSRLPRPAHSRNEMRKPAAGSSGGPTLGRG